jgi:tetratricopeptide (TPR) repeat protein
MGLYQQAVAVGTAYLSRKEAKAETYTAFSEALIKAKRYEDALLLLETARLRYPDDKNVVIQLARAYMEGGHLFVAARLFEQASRVNPDLTLDAAELYRRAGRPGRAVRLNEKVADQKSKVRQRLGLLIELERFDEAVSLAPRLARLGLIDEDAVRYGLAYAHFMTGRFEAAEKALEPISDPALFEKALQLRKIMGTCASAKWQCL